VDALTCFGPTEPLSSGKTVHKNKLPLLKNTLLKIQCIPITSKMYINPNCLPVTYPYIKYKHGNNKINIHL
jgi:hypothetical protein